jgi:hypothetical protein
LAKAKRTERGLRVCARELYAFGIMVSIGTTPKRAPGGQFALYGKPLAN